MLTILIFAVYFSMVGQLERGCYVYRNHDLKLETPYLHKRSIGICTELEITVKMLGA